MSNFKMKYEIIPMYAPLGSKRRSGKKIKPKFQVAHDTGNKNSTALQNAMNYRNNPNISSSAHGFTDDKHIIETLPVITGTPEQGFHVRYNVTGDNVKFGDDANDIGTGMELCYGDNINFNEAYKRYVWYHALVCHRFGMNPAKDITAHMYLDPARRSDPDNALKRYGKDFTQFIQDVIREYAECTAVEVKPVAPVTSKSIHIIESGDTLWGISEQFDIDLDDLLALNPSLEATELRIGTKVYLKPAGDYTVKKGDTAWDICQRYKFTLDSLQKENKGVDLANLSVGQILNFPEKTEAPKPIAPTPKPIAKPIAKPITKPVATPLAVVPYPNVLFKAGMKGHTEDIKRIQRAVNVKADGIFGNGTRTAVINYQKRHGLVADGIVGRTTWNKMF